MSSPSWIPLLKLSKRIPSCIPLPKLPMRTPSWIPLPKLHIFSIWGAEELWSSFQQQLQINPQVFRYPFMEIKSPFIKFV